MHAAYTSQTCPACGLVEAKNRRGDMFQCLDCGYGEYADRVAAINLLARSDDPEVTRYTPYREVRSILLERFHRRLETPQGGTAPGRTLDTVNLATSTAYRKKAASLLHSAVHQRAKQHVMSTFEDMKSNSDG